MNGLLKWRKAPWRRMNNSIWDKDRGRSTALFPWLEIDAKVKKK
jgi:hypothetical protein